MNITVYSKPGCQQCKFICLAMDHAGIPYIFVDLTTNAAALEYVQDLGYFQAPVVVVDDHHHWSGFNPTEIERLRLAIHWIFPKARNPVPHEDLMQHSPAPSPANRYFPEPIAAIRSHHDQFPWQKNP